MDQTPIPFFDVDGGPQTPASNWLAKNYTGARISGKSQLPEPLDRSKCMLIGLCHDLAESVVGDIPTYANVPKEQKHKQESLGFAYILDLVQAFPDVAQDIRNAWDEYEHGRTPEGRWMKEMDKFECLVQAHEYEKMTLGMKDLEEFQGLTDKIKSPVALGWLEILRQDRGLHMSRRQRRLPIIFATGCPNFSKSELDELSQLCQNVSIRHIVLADLLEQKSKDADYRHAQVLETCLREQMHVPTTLLVGLLEQKIGEHMDEEIKPWLCIHGFPNNLEQLVGFEQNVQAPNYSLIFNLPTGEVGEVGNTSQSHAWKTGETSFKQRLMGPEGYYKQIDDTRIDLVAQALGVFIEHAKAQEQ